jgi:hypothetical protein
LIPVRHPGRLDRSSRGLRLNRPRRRNLDRIRWKCNFWHTRQIIFVRSVRLEGLVSIELQRAFVDGF